MIFSLLNMRVRPKTAMPVYAMSDTRVISTGVQRSEWANTSVITSIEL